MQRTMIAGDDDRDIAARRFLEERKQRRPFEPLLRDGPQRDLVTRHFEQNHRFAAAVGEHVHEVEHERMKAFAGNGARQVALQIGGVGGGRDLVIAHGGLHLQLLEMRHQQIALVQVERVVVLLAPPVGKARGDFPREQPAEQRIARVRRGGGENRVVVRGFHVVQRGQQRLEHAPLIHPQAVDDHENRLAITRQNRHHEFCDDVDREGWPVAFELTEPARIFGADERRELAMHVGIEPAQRLVQPHLIGRGEIDVPLHELRKALDPAAPIEPRVSFGLDRTEPLHERTGQRLRANQRTFEDAGDDRQHLTRRHRLHEIITHVRADRFLERRVLFALGDHHDRHGRQHLADVLVRIQSACAGHLLIKQHQVVRAPSQELERVVGVRRRLDVIALVSEQESMRFEKLRFVVHPENRFCHQRHRRKVPAQQDHGLAAMPACRTARPHRTGRPRTRYIRTVHAESLPYALDPLRFPFPALASLAGRLPLGGGREVALAALMTARLAQGVTTGETLQLGERVTRAAAAKVWLASLALPATTRVPFARCVESTTGTSLDVAGALRSLVAAAGTHLDGPSVQELERLARQLAG